MKYNLLVFFFIYLSAAGFGQNQPLADSLELLLSEKEFTDTDKLPILQILCGQHPDIDKQLHYADEMILIAERLDSVDYVASGYMQKGSALRLKGDLSQALENFFTAAEIVVKSENRKMLGSINVAIADVYSVMDNHERSISYYRKAIGILEEVRDSVSLASAYLNAGDEYFNYGELDSALLYFSRSGEIFNAVDYQIGKAYNLGNIGLVYAEQGRNREAEKNITQAVKLLEKLGDYYAVSVYLTYMSDIYRDKGDYESAMNFAFRSLELAESNGLKEQISDANLKLSELYEASGDTDKAFDYYKEYIHYRDSVSNVKAVEQMANIRADYEVSQKQIEVDLLNAEKRNQQLVMLIVGIFLVAIAILAFSLYRRNLFIQRTKAVIEEEKKRSDDLLLNILPGETAAELKEKGKVAAKKYDSVTVMFTDFVSFTRHAEKLPPEALVKTVDSYFSRFDEIMDKYGLEKIKTIGDAYMAAGGLPFPTKDHASKMIQAALEIIAFVKSTKEDPAFKSSFLDVRIGINTGPVVAGVVGIRKFAYDIWGDTVNIAARIESSSIPGKINISENTYKLVNDEFDCFPRGIIKLKGDRSLQMYFVKQAKTPAHPVNAD